MPAPSAFVSSFGIMTGIQIGSFILDNIAISHQVVKRYHEYHFPMTITFHRRQNGSISDLIQQFTSVVSQHRIVNSEYGNPYDCWIESIQIISDNGYQVTLQTLGIGIRVYHR